MAQEIMGGRDGFIIDHVNRDPLDNRRENLRWATRSQNAINWPRKNALGHRGVFRNGSGFGARIKVFGRRIYLGTFAAVSEAAAAYERAAEHFHKEFAIKANSHV